MNTERAVAVPAGGAGGRKVSLVSNSSWKSVSSSVGRKVPEVSVVSMGRGPAAWSLSTRFTRLTFVWTVFSPPTSDMMSSAVPSGATRRTSRSSGKGWVTFSSCTSTSVMVPLRPDTVMGDG